MYPICQSWPLITLLQIIFEVYLKSLTSDSVSPGISTRYRSTNSSKVWRIGYPARRILTSVIYQSYQYIHIPLHYILPMLTQLFIMVHTMCNYHELSISSPDSLHHTSISQLPGAELSVKCHSLFELIRFDTSNKEGLTLAECVHQGIQGTFELKTKSWRLLTSLLGLQQQQQQRRVQSTSKFMLYLYYPLTSCRLTSYNHTS